jgi:tRNA threonylcarbamoyladenosine biosynthesis protein TsaE
VSASAPIVTRSPGETEALGQEVGRTLGPGDVVALTGDLGAGKTCFARGLVRGLGSDARVTSPTFVMINEYPGPIPIHHVDAYRTESLSELMDLGLPELFADGVTIVEWGDKLVPLLPEHAVRVHIEGAGDEPRAIRITRAGGSVSTGGR